MNIVHKLTLRHLKANKSRSVVTTLGIMISVAMITAVFVALASFMRLTADIDVQNNGDYVAALYETTPEIIQALRQDDRVEVGIANTESISFQLSGDYKKYQSTGSIYTADSEDCKLMVLGSYNGQLPTKPDEIAVESDFIKQNGLDWKIGDTITLPTGHRVYTDETGETWEQDGMTYSPAETFSYTEDRNYTITAILHHNEPTYGSYWMITGVGTKAYTQATAHVKLKSMGMDSYKVLEDVMKKAGTSIDACSLNKSLLASQLAFAEDSSYASLVPLIGIVLFLIIVASVSLIYNAFAMSLSERVRYLGMLASVGATRKQKRGSIYYEGFILGLIGIPLGILSGIIGIAITLRIVGDKIISSGMLTNGTADTLTMHTVVPVWAIIGILIFSILTIFISAFIPAQKASKITPIDAIRQREEIRVKARALKCPRIIRKIFGYEGELAYKNQKRNGRKGRVIVASMILSIGLFLSVQYFCDLLEESVNLESKIPYQLQLSTPYANHDALKKLVEQTEGVKACYGINYELSLISKDENDDLLKELVEDKNLTEEGKKKIAAMPKDIWVYMYYLDDEDFNALCEKNGINKDEFYGDVNSFLLMRQMRGDEKETVFSENIVGQELKSWQEMSFNENGEPDQTPTRIGGLINYDPDNAICNLAPTGVILYMPQSVYVEHLDTADEKDNVFYHLAVESDTYTETETALKEAIEQSDIASETGFANLAEQQEVMKATSFIMKVFLYGFIVLITLIIMANIINTVSTGIMLRKKEFAMLKSVGMTQKGFNKMIALESALYGIKATLVGIPLAVVLSYWMYTTANSDTLKFTINLPVYILAILVLFLLLAITMVYSVRKLKDDSIIETLKAEIS